MKTLGIVIISMVGFYLVNYLFSILFIHIYPFADYHAFSYAGLVLLSALIVLCTCIIVEKLNQIKQVYIELKKKEADL